MERLKKFLIEQDKKSFLDVGTGGGAFIGLIDSLYKGYDSFVGIDIIERTINAANERNKNDKIEFKVMDAYNMDYPDESFDVVCFSNSLHHVEDISKIFVEMKRVLKKDGFMIVNEMINNDLSARQKSHMLLHHFAAKIDRLYGDIHFETFSDQEITDMLNKKTGLHVESSWKLEFERKEENTEEEIEYLLNLVDRVFSKVKEEDIDNLINEKEEIKTYIKNNGYDSCTSMVTILRK